jgi:hypothetical protein
MEWASQHDTAANNGGSGSVAAPMSVSVVAGVGHFLLTMHLIYSYIFTLFLCATPKSTPTRQQLRQIVPKLRQTQRGPPLRASAGDGTPFSSPQF